MIIQHFLTSLKDALGQGQRVFVTVVADHTKHSPGTRGAKLLLHVDGTIEGTVGGGIMEKRLLDSGRAVLGGDEAFLQSPIHDLYHRRNAPGRLSGMICAGRQTNVSFVAEPSRDLRAITEAQALVEKDEPGQLMFSHRDGFRLEALPDDHDHFDVRLVQGGAVDDWSLAMGVLALDRVAVFGAGHCGLAMSRQMSLLGYTTSIADTREDVPTLLDNRDARYRHVVGAYEDAAALIRYPRLTPAIVMTADFPSDVAAIAGALSQPFPFIGVMGANAKRVAILKALRERGFDETALSRLTMPVGVPIQSSTPSEIAVSVAAQLIALKPTLFPSRQPSPFDPESAP